MRLDGFCVSKLFVQPTLTEVGLQGPQSVAPNFQEKLDSGKLYRITPKYFFQSEKNEVFPGQTVSLRHGGAFVCTSCAKKVKKLFDGYCFPCLKSKASADTCIMSPHLCHYAAGTCREPTWGETFCYTPHFVYLSYTDKYKVGITRANQIPTRWIDQGATMAAAIARVTSRHQAGVIEKLLCEQWADKSHWLRMLQAGNGRPSEAAFREQWHAVREYLLGHKAFESGSLLVPLPVKLGLAQDIEVFNDASVFEIEFPGANQMERKFNSQNLDKSPEISGKIEGIKGQYLIFEHCVVNVRRHEGYVVDLESDAP